MYSASQSRYDTMPYNRLGASGLKLSAVFLGLWHNFGDTGRFDNMKQMCFTAFDNGITHFDLANNYGPPEGTAEINFGRILKEDLGIYRDGIVTSVLAGASRPEQVLDNIRAAKNTSFSADELALIDQISR